MARAWRRGLVRHDFDAPMPDMPARPAEPEFLPPNQMPKRGRGGSERGRIELLHVLAHIAFVANDLAFDMAGGLRSGFPRGLHGGWIGVGPDDAASLPVLGRTWRDVRKRIWSGQCVYISF